jgi:hypothetical protein
MVRHASGESVLAYVHAGKQHFDDLSECLQLKDGSAAIHPHVLALVMIRGLSNVGLYGKAKQCAINAFDTTDFIQTADRVKGSIIHQAQNLESEDIVALYSATCGHPLNAFLSDRKRQRGRGSGNWVANKRPDMTKFPMKCGAVIQITSGPSARHMMRTSSAIH